MLLLAINYTLPFTFIATEGEENSCLQSEKGKKMSGLEDTKKTLKKKCSM